MLQKPLPKPEFVLTDTNGKPFDFRAQTAGKVTLLYFGYTHCPDVCPTNMATLAAAVAKLPASVDQRIDVVFVSTDPARDTPAVIRTWLNQFNSSFIGLTGNQIEVANAQLQSGLGTSSKETAGNGVYGINHPAFILVYTPDNLTHIAIPSGLSPSLVASDLKQLVQKGWQA